MRITTDAQLLSAQSKPYNFEGKEGVSHKVRLNVEGEIFVCSTDEAGVKLLQDKIGKEGTAILDFTSPKERLKLSLVEFA